MTKLLIIAIALCACFNGAFAQGLTQAEQLNLAAQQAAANQTAMAIQQQTDAIRQQQFQQQEQIRREQFFERMRQMNNQLNSNALIPANGN
jgi:hypothetical protein